MKKIIWILLFSCGILTGCATFQPWVKLEKTEFVDKTNDFKADVPVGWMRSTLGKDFYITYDGGLLNRISVDRAKFNEELPNTKRRFTPEMTVQELAEVSIDVLKSNANITNVGILSNKPLTVDEKEAFELAYTFINKDGLKYEGRTIGMAHGKGMYLIAYEAPAQHYFAKSQDVFDNFVKSFHFIK